MGGLFRVDKEKAYEAEGRCQTSRSALWSWSTGLANQSPVSGDLIHRIYLVVPEMFGIL